MKTGIIVYSHSGNTLSVAETLKNALLGAEKEVVLEKIEVNPDNPSAEYVQVVKAPDTKPYDLLVFASPVHGFRISKGMVSYLESLPDLTGKRVVCFVTHFFPFAFMGGKSSMEQMKNLCIKKGADVVASAIIDWKNMNREKEIEKMVSTVVGLA
jgi:flavodoxin